MEPETAGRVTRSVLIVVCFAVYVGLFFALFTNAFNTNPIDFFLGYNSLFVSLAYVAA